MHDDLTPEVCGVGAAVPWALVHSGAYWALVHSSAYWALVHSAL